MYDISGLLTNDEDGAKKAVFRLGGMQHFSDLIHGAQTLKDLPAIPAACEGRWRTVLGASGGFSPWHSIAFRLESAIKTGATFRAGRHSPSSGSKAAGWPPGLGHDAPRPAGSAGTPMSMRMEWHQVDPQLECACS